MVNTFNINQAFLYYFNINAVYVEARPTRCNIAFVLPTSLIRDVGSKMPLSCTVLIKLLCVMYLLCLSQIYSIKLIHFYKISIWCSYLAGAWSYSGRPWKGSKPAFNAATLNYLTLYIKSVFSICLNAPYTSLINYFIHFHCIR